MTTAWPVSKLALFSISLMERLSLAVGWLRHWCGLSSPTAGPMNPYTMPDTPAKGPMKAINTSSNKPLPISFVCVQPKQREAVDVSQVARHIHFWSPVVLDNEAFGVMVTRREGTNSANLLPRESARLLDLLIAAKEFLGQCEQEPKQFDVWAIPSDSRDGRPRNIWLEMRMDAGAYRIVLADM